MDWIATVFVLLGYVLAGYKYKWAFLYSIIGSVIWVWYAYSIELWSLVAVNSVFIVIGTISLRKWLKDSKNEKK